MSLQVHLPENGTSDRLAYARAILRGEAAALELVANRLDGAFLKAVELLKESCGRVCVTGTGKSADVGQKIAGTLNSTGTRAYSLDATTSWPGHCAWTSPTGDREHPLTAPAPFDLGIRPDPRKPGVALVSFTTVQASLGNAYVGTECANRVDEPQPEETSLLAVAPSRLRGKTITLRFQGTRTIEDLTATWSTVFVLKRVGR